MKTALVEGKKVTIGDYVGFKSDYEQSGKIIDIKFSRFGGKILVLENENGFGGEYLRYDTKTEVLTTDCWL